MSLCLWHNPFATKQAFDRSWTVYIQLAKRSLHPDYYSSIPLVTMQVRKQCRPIFKGGQTSYNRHGEFSIVCFLPWTCKQIKTPGIGLTLFFGFHAECPPLTHHGFLNTYSWPFIFDMFHGTISWKIKRSLYRNFEKISAQSPVELVTMLKPEHYNFIEINT